MSQNNNQTFPVSQSNQNSQLNSGAPSLGNFIKQYAYPIPPVPGPASNSANPADFKPKPQAPPNLTNVYQNKPNNQYAVSNKPVRDPPRSSIQQKKLNIHSTGFDLKGFVFQQQPNSNISQSASVVQPNSMQQQPNSNISQSASVVQPNSMQQILLSRMLKTNFKDFTPASKQQSVANQSPSTSNNTNNASKASLFTVQQQNATIIKKQIVQEFDTMQSSGLIADMSCHQARVPTKTIKPNSKDSKNIGTVQNQTNIRYNQSESTAQVPQFQMNYDMSPQKSAEEQKAQNSQDTEADKQISEDLQDEQKQVQSEQVIEIRDLIKTLIGEKPAITKLYDIMKFKDAKLAKEQPKFMLPNLGERNLYQKQETKHKGFSDKFNSGSRRNTFNYSYNKKRKDQQQQQHQHLRKDIGGGGVYTQNRQQNWEKGKVNVGLSESYSGFSRSEFKAKSEEQKLMEEEAKKFMKESEASKDLSFDKIKISLNKITPDNFDRISSELANIYSQDREKNKDIIIQVTMNKAQNEDKYTQMYANLIEVITFRELRDTVKQFSTINDEKKKKFKLLDQSNFRVALIKKCEETFNSIFCQMVDDEKKDVKLLSQLKAKNNEQDIEEIQNIELRMQIRRKKKLGTIRFIGQLLMKDLILHRIAYSIIDQLIKQNDNSAMEMCTIFITQVGRYFSNQFKKRKEEIGKRLQILRGILQSNKMEKRINLLIKNLLELSENKFEQIQLSSKQGPMTIDDVHASMQQQQQQRSGPKYPPIEQKVVYREVKYQKTLGQKIQEEKHRQSIVTKSNTSGTISNAFNFFSQQGGDIDDNKTSLDIQQVTSQKGEASDEEDDQKTTKNQQDIKKQESEQFRSSVHKNFDDFCQQPNTNSEQLQSLINSGYGFFQILAQLLSYMLVDVNEEDSKKFLPYFEAHYKNLNIISSQGLILKGLNYFLEKFYINIGSDISETKFSLFIQILQTWTENNIIRL